MAQTTPVVQAETVTWSRDRHEHQLTVGTPAWYAWLEEVSTFAFVSDKGTFTARKEPGRHGGAYWKAYRKREGKLHRAYLGKSRDVTLLRLNAVAAQLSGQGDAPDRWASGNETVQAHQASITPLPTNVIVTQRLASPESAPKHDLPLQLTSFVGREQEVIALCHTLRRPDVRLLTLTGVAGVGKTRLALEVARDLVHDFADGIHLVSLAPIRDPAFVIPTIAHSLGLTESGSQPLMERLKISQRDKHRLLLLDNFEHVITVATSLVELLETCPGLKLLVTSREVLRLRGEHQFAVLPLALPDLTCLPDIVSLVQVPAVQLFIQRVQFIQSDFHVTPDNAETIAKICLRLDGLPLAIELAAAHGKLLAPQALLDRLDHRLHVLTGGARDLPERQQTLRNTITWSYDLLTEEEQQLFRRLAVFVGGCQLAAVEAVSRTLDDGTLPIWHGMSSLIDKSFLQVTEQAGERSRFIMLETIREYGLECLAIHGEEEATRRAHTAYYLRLAEEAQQEFGGPKEPVWLRQLEAEHDNLRTAMNWLLEREEGEAALRLGGALFWFWVSKGFDLEGWNFLKQALEGSEAVETPVRAQALMVAGNLAAHQRLFELGEMLCKESLALCREMGDTVGMSGAAFHLALIAFLEENFLVAYTLFEKSIRLCRASSDQQLTAWSLSFLALICVYRGEYARIPLLAQESLTHFSELGFKGGMAFPFLILAESLFAQGDLAGAHLLAEKGLALCQEAGFKPDCAEAIALLGMITFYQGNTETGYSLIEKSLVLQREIGDEKYIAWSLAYLGKATAVQGDYARARTLYEESLARAGGVSDKRLLTNCLEGLADVATGQGNPTWAARLWGAAEALRDAMGTPIAPFYLAQYERSVAASCARLGEQAFITAWTEGRCLTPEQVLGAPGQAVVSIQTSAGQSAISTTKSSLPSPNGLTAREVEVLRLLTQGLTSAQMAERLVIGVVTVNFHVRSIYSKLGVSSRSAATRYAIEHRLV